MLKHSKGIEPEQRFFEPLIQILKIFEIGKRPEIMKALAFWTVIMESDIERAKKLTKAGIESINGDPKLDESVRESWRQEFDPINKIISNIEARHDH